MIDSLILAAASHEVLQTIGIAVFLGVGLMILADRIQVSSIVLLLFGGIIAGPEVLGLVNPESLGSGLHTIVAFSVGIILFEGGLSLNIQGYKETAREIWGVLTLGVAVTWIGSALLLWAIFDFDLLFCFLSASLIIVTGPTVIAPLLQRIRVKKNLHHILHWEGVLIDPIGVFIALFCYKLYTASQLGVGEGTGSIWLDLGVRFLAGGAIGVAFGYVLGWILRKDWIPHHHVNIFMLATAMLIFFLADTVRSETGLLSVTVAGLVIGTMRPPQLRAIVEYKEEFKDLLIGLLFILLAANLELAKFAAYGFGLIGVVAAVMFIIRPLNIFLSMGRTNITLNDKLFLSWIAPRGIVAASMASIFAYGLKEEGIAHAGFLETFAYSVIVGTVVIQGFTGGLVAKWLGVLEPKSAGWIIIGAHRMGRSIARFLKANGVDSVLLDANAREVLVARKEGLTAISEDARTIEPENMPIFYGSGNLLAITPNQDLNQLLCRQWSTKVKGLNVFRWQRQLDAQDEHDSHSGQPVWCEAQVGPFVRPGEERVPLRVRKSADPTKFPAANILVSIVGDEVYMGAPPEKTEEAQLLMFDSRDKDGATPLPISKSRVFFSSATTVKQLYSEMLERMKSDTLQIEIEETLELMMEREHDYSDLLGHGIAIPHLRSSKVSESVMVVARPKDAALCEIGHREVKLAFMLLSPEDQPAVHLGHISHIASMIGPEASREELIRAKDEQSLYEQILRG